MPPKAEPVINGGVRFGRVSKTLKMGVVGLPNIGKSSLFNLLTKTSLAAAENFPFCTIEPNEARCPVPDERYDHLCEMWQPGSRYPAFLQVWDIAGLIRGASEGAGLGNKFLSHIGAVDGIFHMVRSFENEDVQHVEDTVDPVRDLETITSELCRKDLQLVESAIAQEIKDVKRSPTMKLSVLFTSTMDKIKALLTANRPVKDAEWTTPEIELIKEKLQGLVTTKPQVYLVNLTARDYERKKNKHLPAIHQWIQAHGGGPMIPISVEWEALHADDAPDAPDADGAKSALPRIITEGFKCLDLIYFFTAGDKEVRCWTIPKGWTAPQAGGVIHSDMENFFVKAEVVGWEDFKTLQKSKGMSDVKAAGKFRMEGKSYVVQDGDIIHYMVGKK
jgi:obg-like ATPase 1